MFHGPCLILYKTHFSASSAQHTTYAMDTPVSCSYQHISLNWILHAQFSSTTPLSLPELCSFTPLPPSPSSPTHTFLPLCSPLDQSRQHESLAPHHYLDSGNLPQALHLSPWAVMIWPLLGFKKKIFNVFENRMLLDMTVVPFSSKLFGIDFLSLASKSVIKSMIYGIYGNIINLHFTAPN